MILIFIVIAIVVSWWYYRSTQPPVSTRQRLALAGLRGLSLAILLILLFNPILHFFTTSRTPEQMVFLQDRSQSMVIITAGKPKYNLWQDASNLAAKAAQDAGYTLTYRDFPEPGYGQSTLLVPTLQSILTDEKLQPLSRILLASDGYLKDENLDAILTSPVPIDVIIPENPATQVDLAIDDMQYNQTTYQQDETPIALTLTAENYRGEATVTLQWAAAQELSQKVDFSQNPVQQLLLSPQFITSGLQQFTARIWADSLQEASVNNNRYSGAIQVITARENMLILTDQLQWDVKFIKDAIGKNPHWDATVLRYHKGWWLGNTSVELASYIASAAVICVVNSQDLNFDASQVSLLSQRVQQGTGLMLCGKPVPSLDQLNPATMSGISRAFSSTFTISSAGKEIDIFSAFSAAETIPPVTYWYTRPRLESSLLATIDNDQRSPAIVRRVFGQGTIMQFCFVDLWRWQLREGDSGFSSLIDGLFQYLAATSTQRFAVQASQPAYFLGESVDITLHAYNEALQPVKNITALAEIYRGDSLVVADYFVPSADGYSISLRDLAAGSYRVTATDDASGASDSTAFVILPQSPEVRDMGINDAMLRFIATTTGGRVLQDASFPQAEISSSQREHRIPLYRKWYIILLFIGGFSGEWLLRKRWGLL